MATTIRELTDKLNHDHVLIGWKLQPEKLLEYLDSYLCKGQFASDTDVTTKKPFPTCVEHGLKHSRICKITKRTLLYVHCTNCSSYAHNLDWCPYEKMATK